MQSSSSLLINMGMPFSHPFTFIHSAFLYFIYVSQRHISWSSTFCSQHCIFFSFYLKHILHLYCASLLMYLILKVLSYCSRLVYIHFVFIYVPLFGLALIFKWVFNFSIFVVQFRDYNMYPWFTKVLKLLILFTHLPYTDLSAKWVYFNSIIIKIMIHNFWSFIWFNI